VPGERRANALGADRAATQRDDLALARARQQLADDLLLQHTECSLTVALEDLGDRPNSARLDQLIDIADVQAAAGGQLACRRRLAGPHESDQNDRAAGAHWIRAR
jgi:hypothetical protein